VFPVTQVAVEKLITRNISGLKSGVSFGDVSELKRKLRNLTSLAFQPRKLAAVRGPGFTQEGGLCFPPRLATSEQEGKASRCMRKAAREQKRSHLQHRFAMRILSTLGRRYLDLCRTVRNQEPWCSVSPSLTCPAAANRSDWPAENFSEFLANSLRRLASSHLRRLRRRWWDYVPGQHPDLPTIVLTSINR
jgi:hypothetical protein